MNHRYRLVKSKKHGRYVVAPETAKSHIRSGKLAKVLVAAAIVTSSQAFAENIADTALPTNPSVAAGAAQFNYDANKLIIQQTTDKLITNWSNFDIGKNAAVQFVQPSATAAALNRINSNDPTYILGSLTANGRVILINQSGVIFGSGAQVDVDSLIASTLNLSNQSFLNNMFSFENLGNSGSILNEGQLRAFSGGMIALVAPVISNAGTIQVDSGTAGLFAGEKVTLALDGNRLVKYTIDQGALNALIQNNGAIKVAEGLVVLSAKGVEQVSKSVVNTAGLIAATGITEVGGKIILEGDEVTLASGSLTDASGPKGVVKSMSVAATVVLIAAYVTRPI